MLTHVAQAASIIVPVSPEGAVDAVRVVRLVRCGPEPEVVIEFIRDGLRCQVGAADPIELPVEAGRGVEGDLERTVAQHPVHHGLADVLHRNTHAVEVVLEAEPGVEAEDALVLLHGGHDGTTLGDGPGHGLLAPDVLARLGRGNGDDGVPVRRGGHVDDVDVLAGQHLAEVFVAFAIGAAGLHRLRQMVGIHVAHRQQLAGGVDRIHMPHAHAAGADHGAGKDFTRGRMAGAAENMSWNNGHGGHRGDGVAEEAPACQWVVGVHDRVCDEGCGVDGLKTQWGDRVTRGFPGSLRL